MLKYILLMVLLVLPQIAGAQILNWSLVAEPTDNKPKIYGLHTAGCMDGAIRLPARGDGFVLGDVHDNRAYGQPSMLSYIEKLSSKFHEETGRTLIISDISSPRGGPVPIESSLHQSHQTGLDVDIWFSNARKTQNQRDVKQLNMLEKGWNMVSKKHWGKDKVAVLKSAASFEEVDRIFVNPIIKNELCRHFAGEEWMHKIRPWYGHAAHFHVRLKCPEGSRDCKMQAPVPEGNGCGKDLEWWFSDEAKFGTGKAEPRKYPVLPKQCDKVFVAK